MFALTFCHGVGGSWRGYDESNNSQQSDSKSHLTLPCPQDYVAGDPLTSS